MELLVHLHKEFRIKEYITRILELLSDYSLYGVIEKRINELEQHNQAVVMYHQH
ncbi:MAG: hypothetical protein ACR5K2_03885 [Wolbachia sp.]